jgi:hypothetical protein
MAKTPMLAGAELVMPNCQSERPAGAAGLVVVSSLLFALSATPSTWAWGHLGHRITARLAERHLTPTAREAVKALLEEGETLADASTWADQQFPAIGYHNPARAGLVPTPLSF